MLIIGDRKKVFFKTSNDYIERSGFYRGIREIGNHLFFAFYENSTEGSFQKYALYPIETMIYIFHFDIDKSSSDLPGISADEAEAGLFDAGCAIEIRVEGMPNCDMMIFNWFKTIGTETFMSVEKYHSGASREGYISMRFVQRIATESFKVEDKNAPPMNTEITDALSAA